MHNSPMSNQIKEVLLFFLGLFMIKVEVAAVQNETLDFSSNQEIFVGEDALLKWSLHENLANKIADLKFGVVTRPAKHGERLDAILVKTFPSGYIKWNFGSTYVDAYVNRTEVIQSELASFRIRNVRLNDTAEFYCTVRQTGESETMITDYVKLKVIDIQILNKNSSREVISWKGHKISLHCNVRIVPNTSRTRPEFTWRNKALSGTVVDPSKQRDTINGSQLTILTYKDTDFGPYECVARTPTTEQRHVIHIKRLYAPSEPGNFSHSLQLIKLPNCTVAALLSWMLPLRDGGASVTHYIVEYKPFEQDWSKASRQMVDTNQIKICRPPRDQGGDGLRVRVKAKNKVGVGNPSAPTIVTFWDEPSAPLNLKSRLRRNLGSPFVELKWDSPLYDGGRPVSEYRVEYKPVGKAWHTAARLQTVEKEMIIWKSYHDEELYQVRVSATNGIGFGESSSILKVAFADVPSKPLEVVEKTILHVTKRPPHIHIAWRRPLDNGGLRITHYRIEYKKVTQKNWKLARFDLVVDEKYVIKDVKRNQRYDIRVSAKNDIGFGAWSKPVVVKYKDQNFVAFKARSQGSKLTAVDVRVLELVFLMATILTIVLPR